ncbi:MAG: sensor histidine kinase, partial [Promethearchaeota archaeon]
IFILLFLGVDIGEQKGILPIYFITPFFLVIILVIFIINNYISRTLAIYIFLSIFITLIILADTPKELIEGRSIMFFSLPIFFTGILLKSRSIFLVAIIIGIIHIILSLFVNSTPNLLAVGLFLVLGLTMWLFANGLQKALSYSKAVYHRSNFYKDIFSHDVNNILQNILSSSQLLSQYVNDPKKEEDFRVVIEILNEEVSRGAYLVSNVRKLSQLEEEELSLEITDGLILLKNVRNNIANSHKRKKIDIQIQESPEKILVFANELLGNVFENLLDNAIKHNTNSHVIISIIISTEIVDKTPYFKFEFHDNGIGISDEMKKLIFLRSPNSTEQTRGLGLGLSLVKQIIEKFNGQIWVEDK